MALDPEERSQGNWALTRSFQNTTKRVVPGKDRLNAMLDKASPCLILIDELLEYVVKVGRTEEQLDTERGQLLAFLQELSETVGSRKDAVLVATLPSSALEQYDEKAERTLALVQHVLGRLEAIYTPVEGLEIYEIIRKRLFEDLGSLSKYQGIAQEFYELYEKLGADVPSDYDGINLPKLRVDTLYPGLSPPMAAHTLKILEDELWFLHEEAGEGFRTYRNALFGLLPDGNRKEDQAELKKHLKDAKDRL